MRKKLFAALLIAGSVCALTGQEARYEVKSAIIKKTMEVMGQTMESVQYIDGYGAMEAVYMNMSMPGGGQAMEIRTFNKGDSVISVNMSNKMGQKVVLPEKPVNFLKMTPEINQKYEIKEEGQEEIAGKMCKKYSMVMAQMGVKAVSTVWVWKGISLKSITTASGVTVTELANDVQENAIIVPTIFVIPEGVTIQ
jgi:hypothetical protein